MSDSAPARRARGDVRIGISGWRYTPWRGVFYPHELTQKRELEFAAQCLRSIEINGSFYSLQRPESYAQWHDATPEDFVFAVKGGRYITHMLRLKNCESALANFFAQGLFNLRDKLGPILWQFPPNFQFEPLRLEAFFKLLPRDTAEAARLARRHDARLKGRVVLRAKTDLRLRHAIEIRHESFETEAFIRLLRRYNIALVVADTAGKWPYAEDVTADFVYVRLHGDVELYASGYNDAALSRWARRIGSWSAGAEVKDAKKISAKVPRRRSARDVYCYFDNDIKVHAPFDAFTLMRKLKQPLPALVAQVEARRPLRK